MTPAAQKLYYWSPRLLSLFFAAFVSLFALDVFAAVQGLWPTALALAIHLIPTAIVVLALLIAWHWERIGAMLFAALAAVYVVFVLLAPQGRLSWILGIALPLAVIAALFLVDWRVRSKAALPQ